MLLNALASSIGVNVIKQIAITLGLTALTYTGFDALLSLINAQISNLFSSTVLDVYNYLGLAGAITAVHIQLSALTSLAFVTNFTKLVSRF